MFARPALAWIGVRDDRVEGVLINRKKGRESDMDMGNYTITKAGKTGN